ncbi:hypothetical protein EFS58_06970, partial [Streptococcus thermophilus]|nr:hypothetical protein [Streptococcus thermophilus]
AFHYSSYGTFCVHSKSSIIPTVVLPTTEIIEPVKTSVSDTGFLLAQIDLGVFGQMCYNGK